MIPADHPRAKSLHTRERLVDGFRRSLVVPEGLIAHGRGEAFDYLLGERTSIVARQATRVAAAMLLLSKRPVLSVNGNAAALVPREIVELSEVTGAAIEVNIFYRTQEREKAIRDELWRFGAKDVLGVGNRAAASIPELSSERRRVDPDGIFIADTVFVPLEDGDRAEALARMGKNVITVDLRAMPALVKEAESLKGKDEKALKKILGGFDNRKNLARSLKMIRSGSR
jgi:4-phosphopantoate--beta-alanine ligase